MGREPLFPTINVCVRAGKRCVAAHASTQRPMPKTAARAGRPAPPRATPKRHVQAERAASPAILASTNAGPGNSSRMKCASIWHHVLLSPRPISSFAVNATTNVTHLTTPPLFASPQPSLDARAVIAAAQCAMKAFPAAAIAASICPPTRVIAVVAEMLAVPASSARAGSVAGRKAALPDHLIRVVVSVTPASRGLFPPRAVPNVNHAPPAHLLHLQVQLSAIFVPQEAYAVRRVR